ncbi:MAG: hypothetical protein EOM12_09080 [Verrucomicrobiae bacterium]|nr:hypothetical protein [Verrucomicrobiae bacterium]
MKRIIIIAVLTVAALTFVRGDGVTLITHGWNPDLSGAPAWVANMQTDIITDQLGGENRQGQITVTESLGSLSVSGSYSHTLTSTSYDQITESTVFGFHEI